MRTLQFCWAWAVGTAGAGEASMHRHRSECHMHQQRHTLAAGCIATMGAPALGLGILSVAACDCDPGQFCMQQHARSIAFMHASWLVQCPCLSFSNCGTHTHTGIVRSGRYKAAHTHRHGNTCMHSTEVASLPAVPDGPLAVLAVAGLALACS